MKRLIYIIFVGSIIAGCTSIDVRKKLNDIDSYIAEHPDSALAKIQSISPSDLKTKGLKAHHALLHAMALDKNYIDVTDDSLALTAVRYYRKHGPKKNLARAMYYLALSYYYDGQYNKSIIELTKAEPVAEKYDSLYWGFIKVLQADVYNINYNDIQELECLEKALEIYTNLGREYYINVVKRRCFESYISNKKYNEANKLYEELKSVENQKIKIDKNYAFLLATNPYPDYKLASSYFETVANKDNGKYMTTQDYWVWAYSLSKIGERERSEALVDELKQIDSSGTAFYFMYAIAKNEDKHKEALDYLEKFSDKNNDEVIEILKQSISVIQRDYFQSQYEIADYKAHNRLIIIILICIISLLTGLLIYYSVIRYKKKKEEEKNEYIRYAEEVIHQLKELQKDSYTDLQKKYISMYKTKYETVRNLYEKYVQSDGRTDVEHLMYKKVVTIINDLRNDIGDSKTLERILNEDMNEILSFLHKELPDLSKKDHILIGYLALGFDTVLISHFLNCTTNSIYIRKSRLKKTIEESDAEHKTLFLEIIG